MKTLLFQALEFSGMNALFRRLNRGRIKVLLFHNVTPGGRDFDNALAPEEFEAQLRHLKRHYNVLGIDQSGDWRGYRPDRVNVLISFDDGFINNLQFALPILEREGVPAVFFLIADCVATGSPPPFAEKYGSGDRQAYRTIDAQGARALLDAGMTIGSHSLAHRDFSQLSDAEAQADATAAREKLRALLDTDIGLFAFPWGKHRPGQEQQMAALYWRVFLTDHGFAWPDDVVIPRNEVAGSMQLRAAASGALDSLKGAWKALGRPLRYVR